MLSQRLTKNLTSEIDDIDILRYKSSRIDDTEINYIDFHGKKRLEKLQIIQTVIYK